VNTDSTILNVALPPLVRELHATSSELQWIVDGVAERWARVGDRSPGQRSVALGVLIRSFRFLSPDLPVVAGNRAVAS